jgi:hypothetical protein
MESEMTRKNKYQIIGLPDRDVLWNTPAGVPSVPKPTCYSVVEGLKLAQRVVLGLQKEYPQIIWWIEIL